jgi:succinate-acetate transporter protein
MDNNKKEWANPTPAGLVALALSCFCFFANFMGFIGSNAAPLMAIWLLGGAVIQFTVAICDLKGGNVAGGNTFLYFSAFFMLVGGIERLAKTWLSLHSYVFDARVDGWAWMLLTIVVLFWMPAFFKKFGLLSMVVIFLFIAMPFITLLELECIHSETFLNIAPKIAGISLLLSGLFALWLSAATVVNKTFGRKVFPGA